VTDDFRRKSNELAANLVGNSRLVPAGIVAVNRAQERGYSFAYVG
jgi:intracellular sulfur oxidation DsrE/DsrF family protein